MTSKLRKKKPSGLSTVAVGEGSRRCSNHDNAIFAIKINPIIRPIYEVQFAFDSWNGLYCKPDGTWTCWNRSIHWLVRSRGYKTNTYTSMTRKTQPFDGHLIGIIFHIPGAYIPKASFLIYFRSFLSFWNCKTTHPQKEPWWIGSAFLRWTQKSV